ncbi:MAG TPA: hypothetical protein DC038_11370 [Clostridiales bacterium]|nr:hypothetical protein [Clostridiales bacterium]
MLSVILYNYKKCDLLLWEEVMIYYRDIPLSQISDIKSLWERNRKYHEHLSESFGHLYTGLVFEDRMKPFRMFGEEFIKITLAENGEGEMLGYCISTIEGGEGETQSLHVAEEARDQGIGKKLMNSHIEWLKNNGCTNILVTVSFENINTVNFYKSLGFKENTMEMRL